METQPLSIGLTADETVFLNGRPPMGEFLGFVSSQAIEGQTAAPGDLAGAWRAANSRIRELEASERGFADNAPIGPIAESLNGLSERVAADPIVQRTFAVVPFEVGEVDLDRLVVFQKHINLAYVQELRQLLGDKPTEDEIFQFSLPYETRFDPPVQGVQTAQNMWTFVSPSTDFRFLDARLVEPSLVSGLDASGAPTAVLALSVGYGSNYLSVLQIEGRLILNNGSHRAYALREMGLRKAPCLVQKLSLREELEVAGNAELVQNAAEYLEKPRPAVLKDYFDPDLRMVLHVPRKARQLRVAFQVEQFDVPSSR